MSPLDQFLSAPPISRTLAAVTFIFSVLLYTSILPFAPFFLSSDTLFKIPPEVWRLITTFLITGPHLSILFDTYFLYWYGAKLELASPRFIQRADFVTYICFVCGVVSFLNLLPIPIISGVVLASPLSLCFVTSWTRDAWDQPVTFFVIKMPAQYLPFAIIFLKLIIGSPRAAMIEATGLVAAYAYDLMTGLYPNFGIKSNFIPTPRWMNKMLGTQRVIERPYGSIIAPGGGEAAWGLDLSWKRFGPGHTLGGEGVRVDRQRPKGLALAAMVMGSFVLVCLVLGYLFLKPDTWPVPGLPWLGAATDTPKSGI